MITTFRAFLLIMKRASLGPWMKSPGTTRKKPGVPSRGVPFVSDVRVADGEMCATPAATSVWLVDVAGPITATTFWSATYFWASACAGAGPCSTGVSPVSSWIFNPSPGASRLTAYFAQLSCALPRKPAPPVSGVTIAIFIVCLQFTACVALASVATSGLAAAVAATTAAIPATSASAIALLI